VPVLSFGLGDDIEDELAGPAGVLSRTDPVSSGLPAPSSDSGWNWGSFFTNLGVGIAGTAAQVTANQLAARAKATKSPADLAKLKAAQDEEAKKQRNEFLIVGGAVLGVVMIGGLLLRRRQQTRTA
jgi:hypothetical protein